MSHQIEVVRAEFAHLDALAALFDGYRQFYLQPSDIERAKVFLRERLTNSDSVIFIALLDNVAVGFTQLYPSFSSVSMQRLWILNDLFVAEFARRHGVAEALLEHARQFAIQTGSKGLVLETAITNGAAQRLYERLGWQRDDQFYRYALYV
jgi:GNAT superfamily N-acetyltransferase